MLIFRLIHLLKAIITSNCRYNRVNIFNFTILNLQVYRLNKNTLK